MIEHTKDMFGAMFKLPLPVLVWMNILFTVNMVSIPLVFINPHPVVIATLLGVIFGIGPNFYLVWVQRGISKAMSIPHVFPWLILEGYLIIRLFTETYGPRLTESEGTFLYYWVWSVLVCNTISLLLDVNDSIRWFKGERDILRGDETARRLGSTG